MPLIAGCNLLLEDPHNVPPLAFVRLTHLETNPATAVRTLEMGSVIYCRRTYQRGKKAGHFLRVVYSKLHDSNTVNKTIRNLALCCTEDKKYCIANSPESKELTRGSKCSSYSSPARRCMEFPHVSLHSCSLFPDHSESHGTSMKE